MNVLVITNDFPPRIGGIEDYVAQLLVHLPAGISARVLAPRHENAEVFDRSFPHSVIRWGRYPILPTPALARAVGELILQARPDVLIFGAALPLALIAASVQRRFPVPVLAFTHGTEPAAAAVPGGGVILRTIARRVTAFTAVSDWAEQRLRVALGPDVRITQLPSGVDVEQFRPDVSGEAVRQRYRLGKGPVIVCLSRLVRRKGHDQVIRALPSVTKEFPQARVLIVGDGPDRRRLERLAARCGVVDRVVFAGAVPYADLPACFAAGDIFAMPCRSRFRDLENEGLGAVFLQAGGVGRPSIAGRSGGAPEAVRHEETGLVVDGTTTDVEAAILRLLRSPEEARVFGDNAARRIHRDMTWAQMGTRLNALLYEVASSAARGAGDGRFSSKSPSRAVSAT